MEAVTAVIWMGIAGLCGGIVYLVLQRNVSSRLAVTVCLIATMFSIFVGDMIICWFRLPEGSAGGVGFLLGISSLGISTWIANGGVLEWVRKCLERNINKNNGAK